MSKPKILVARAIFPEIIAKLENSGLPFAPIARPEDMFDDPHLLASGGLEPVMLPGGRETMLPLLPIEMDGKRLGTSPNIPDMGADSDAILTALGYGAAAIAALKGNGVVG